MSKMDFKHWVSNISSPNPSNNVLLTDSFKKEKALVTLLNHFEAKAKNSTSFA